MTKNTSTQPGTAGKDYSGTHAAVGRLAWIKKAVDPATGKESYTAALIVKKGTPDYDVVLGVYKQAVADQGGKPPATSPIKQGDQRDEEDNFIRQDEAFRDTIYVNLKTQYAPKVRTRDGATMDFEDIQSGDHCAVAINAYAWSYQGKKGISFGMNSVMFLAPGAKIGGGT